MWGVRSGLYGEWDNGCHLKEMISSTVDEVVGEEGIFMQKKDIFFWASLGRNFFSFSLSLFSNLLLNGI